MIYLAVIAGCALVIGSLVLPVVLLMRSNDRTLARWANIGQALSPVGIFFSGIAFLAIAFALTLQRKEMENQREELNLARTEQARRSEVSLRQLHNDLIKLALADNELLSVWPPISPGVEETKKDHYCNLILNLQKVAYEAHTIELPELQGALRYLMTSPDMRNFWKKIRSARIAATAGDEAEDFFTHEVDQAFEQTTAPEQPSRNRTLASHLKRLLRRCPREWQTPF